MIGTAKARSAHKKEGNKNCINTYEGSTNCSLCLNISLVVYPGLYIRKSITFYLPGLFRGSLLSSIVMLAPRDSVPHLQTMTLR